MKTSYKKLYSLSFDVETDESMLDFISKKRKEFEDFEKVISARMCQLFDEFIGIKEGAKEQKQQVLKVFMLGYGNGWNDRKEIESEIGVHL